ncbi:Cytochrome P450 monooxygenase [Lachnellula occidentalis]|uniref:Cytochrome P450 monooxygenase n=1 Tax=Lachnellula occidentalis TaxID=215460 RepID=A0A8H8RAJ7_9HELO|nr:Cytochrome P450 monooxygenase [Lachnellula occidentalis]
MPILFTVSSLLATSIFGYFITHAFYNAFFHPLARFKGPRLWGMSRIPFINAMLGGTLPFRVKSLHDEYGSIVRVAPDELSFTDPKAWKDIYSHKSFIRPKIWGSRPPGVEAHNVISAGVADHARFRKAFQGAFSEKATRHYEETVQHYSETLISKLKEHTLKDGGETAVMDLVQWLNFTTFDIIGDSGWGSDFGCLRDTQYHPWIAVVLHFKAVLMAVSVMYYPWLEAFLMSITPASALADLQKTLATTHTKVKDRLAHEPERPDIMSHVLEHNQNFPDSSLSHGEIEANSMAVVVAGSETLTTASAGAVTYLLRDPKVFRTLVEENRTNFSSEDQISAASTATLPYLTAVLNETLRLCPPLPDGLRRQVPKGGAVICGHLIPEGMTVSVPCWATFRSSSNFASPDVFSPQRWLSEDSSQFESDNKAAFQPFSTGPHNCIGQPLAWMEMRVILSKLIWNFDINAPKGTTVADWTTQKIYWTWEKSPLEVELKSAR